MRRLATPICQWVALLLCCATFHSPALAAAERFITIGTAGDYGVYFPTGGAICRFVTREVNRHGLRCLVESTEGSIQNLRLVRDRRLNFGIAQSDLQAHAYKGEGVFAAEGANSKLRSLFSLHDEVLTLVVHKDSGIRTLEQLRGKRINIGTAGSGSYYVEQELFRVMGWSRKSFASILELSATEQSKAFCEGRLDAAFYVVGHPNGDVLDITSKCGGVIIPVSGKRIEAFLAANPYYTASVIPARMYPGNPVIVPSLGVKATLVTMEDEDADTVYEVVKGLFEHFDSFTTLHPVFSTLDRQRMVSTSLTAPLHEGAERYFREKGLLKANPLSP